MRKLFPKVSSWIFLLFGLAVCLSGQTPEPRLPQPKPKYKVRLQKSVMVPMRDGVKLSTDLYFPEGAGDKLPVFLVRTPYNKNRARQEMVTNLVTFAYHFAGQGYVVAVQDTRGRFESEGEYLVSAADRKDGYDVVSWLASQPWSNGKVGTYGCSYGGENQMQLAAMRNPHHVAMIPMAAGGSYRYFGFLTGGAVELAPAFGWFWRRGSKVFLRPPPGAPSDFYAKLGDYFNPAPVLPEIDYRTFWKTLPLIDMMDKAGAPPTDFEGFVAHEPADPWWNQFGYIKDTDRFDVPALHINSWYDYGVADTLKLFNLLRTNAASPRARDNQFVIISPTTHCRSWSATEQTIVGERNVGDAQFDFIYGLRLRWFDYWLKGIENGVTTMPKVQIYVMGKNEWRGENEWPLARTQFTKYYLHSDGKANSRFGTGTPSTSKARDEPADHYLYDPQTPVPSVGGPVCCTGTPDAPAGAFDQSEVETRHDVLVYTLPVLEEGIEVTGPIEVVLYVSSSARDTDFTAKLVDVYPDGTAYNVQEGILRARYRKGYDKKVWMKPGGVYQVRIDLQATSNYFGPGHRIRLEVSSSTFPRFDRNLNTGGNNYDEMEWTEAENTIHHSSKYPSHIILPVIP